MIRRYMGYVDKKDDCRDIRSHFIGYADAASIDDAFVYFFKQIQQDNDFKLADFLRDFKPTSIDDFDVLQNRDIFVLEKECLVNLGVNGFICYFPVEFDYDGFITMDEGVNMYVVLLDEVQEKLIEISNLPLKVVKKNEE